MANFAPYMSFISFIGASIKTMGGTMRRLVFVAVTCRSNGSYSSIIFLYHVLGVTKEEHLLSNTCYLFLFLTFLPLFSYCFDKRLDTWEIT